MINMPQILGNCMMIQLLLIILSAQKFASTGDPRYIGNIVFGCGALGANWWYLIQGRNFYDDD